MRPNVQVGTFLIRPSSDPNCLALSVRSKENKSDGIIHVKLHSMPDGLSCFIRKPNLVHADIGKLLDYYKVHSITDYGDESLINLTNPFPKVPLLPTIKELEIDTGQVKLFEKIGYGNFGKVKRGQLYGFDVAVKIIRTKTEAKQKVTNPKEMLLKEADKMRRLFHPNLCHLICVSIESKPALLIMEFMNKGSLERCLHNDDFVRQEIHLEFVLLCLKEIANGMKYLSEQNPPIVHRDLRTANVLVHDEKKHLDFKITDFGLTEFLHGGQTFEQSERINLPICWLSPEVLSRKTFTIKSDVWAFGVLAFEIFSLGTNPVKFLGPTLDEAVGNIKNGKTLTRENCIDGMRPVEGFDQEICPEPLFVELEKCWKFQPSDRPHFSSIFDFIDNYDTGFQYMNISN